MKQNTPQSVVCDLLQGRSQSLLATMSASQAEENNTG